MNLSKKNRLLLCIGLVAVIVLAIVYFVFLSAPETNDENQKDISSAKREFIINDISEENLFSVSLSKKGKIQYIIKKDDKTNEFLIEGLEHLTYSQAFKSLISSVSKLMISEKIQNPMPDYEYGILGYDSPYVLEITNTDGITHRIFIGDAISESEYYCKKEGSNEIVIVASAIDNFFVEKYHLLSKVLTVPLEETKYHLTQKFSLYKDMKEFVTIQFVPKEVREQGNIYSAYEMTYPAKYTPADVNYDKVLKNLISPEADTIVTTDITMENLEKYGFKVPSFEIYYTLDDVERKIIFGNRTDDGLIYVLSLDFGFIGLVGLESHFEFLDWDLIEYINPALFGMNIDYISKLTVSGHNFSDTYSLSGKGQELVVTNVKNKSIVDTQNFRQLYRVLLMANMEGYAESDSTDDWILSFTIETTGGEISEYKFYQTSTRKCYYTVNGKGEFYVSVDIVNKILSDAKKLASGEKINADAQI